jgi:signal transduction histidine kinase
VISLFQNALQDKKNFVRYISHELRTPLNVVYMALQLLQKQGVAPAGHKRRGSSGSVEGKGSSRIRLHSGDGNMGGSCENYVLKDGANMVSSGDEKGEVDDAKHRVCPRKDAYVVADESQDITGTRRSVNSIVVGMNSAHENQSSRGRGDTVGNNDTISEPDDTVSDDIISDACDACQLAVNILNNLLMYDRIEDGKMVLDKQNVAVRSLLIKCIHLFEVQV